MGKEVEKKGRSQPSNKPPEDQRISWMRRKEIGVRGREEQRISWIRRKEIGVRGREGVAFYIILRS